MVKYDLGGIFVDTDIKAFKTKNLLVLEFNPNLKLHFKYDAKHNRIMYWQPTGFPPIRKHFGIKEHDLKTGKAYVGEFVGAEEIGFALMGLVGSYGRAYKWKILSELQKTFYITVKSVRK